MGECACTRVGAYVGDFVVPVESRTGGTEARRRMESGPGLRRKTDQPDQVWVMLRKGPSSVGGGGRRQTVALARNSFHRPRTASAAQELGEVREGADLGAG